ncbi:MAG: TMEM165/GDT1 family protein [Candidatus Altiarchaeota archaeon]|nr:TMEM165/GDT1 family protein [Candidatus Altiarchaeota archaeon]
MIADALVPFIAVGLAELGDKTQLSILLLASKTSRHLPLLAGICLAFLIVDGAAIAAGSWITSVVPPAVLKAVSGLVFIFFGVLTLLRRPEESGGTKSGQNPLLSGFMLIFLAEWGDKTQITAALFATRYNPWLVLAGTMASLAMLSAMAIYIGRLLSEKINRSLITRAAGLLFILIGLASFAL